MFFIIARGWGVVREYIMRKEATYVTVALGIVYLNFSAFFVTIELPTMNKIVRVRMCVLHLKTTLVLYRNPSYRYTVSHS